MNYHQMEDELLLGLMARGDRGAMEAFYDRYARQVYSLVYAILRDRGIAEEVAQEVFFKVWRRAASFDPSRGRPTTWLLSVAHHETIDTLRRHRRRRQQEVPSDPLLDPEKPSSEVNPDQAAVMQESREQVQAALKHLPPEQREVLVLAYFQGLTQHEIAEKLGQPLGTVKTRMRLGLQKLRRLLEPEMRREP